MVHVANPYYMGSNSSEEETEQEVTLAKGGPEEEQEQEVTLAKRGNMVVEISSSESEGEE